MSQWQTGHTISKLSVMRHIYRAATISETGTQFYQQRQRTLKNKKKTKHILSHDIET